jgi:hypothetical protein
MTIFSTPEPKVSEKLHFLSMKIKKSASELQFPGSIEVIVVAGQALGLALIN